MEAWAPFVCDLSMTRETLTPRLIASRRDCAMIWLVNAYAASSMVLVADPSFEVICCSIPPFGEKKTSTVGLEGDVLDGCCAKGYALS